jgi:phosphoribosyl-ATP pyrophosphohydrolase/phosphoribosyl-AMP cyclohydrolase
VTFWSRSRNELWEKGATSGNRLELVSIAKNCEANSLLVKARPTGPACHTGNTSCYYRELDPETDLPRVIEVRAGRRTQDAEVAVEAEDVVDSMPRATTAEVQSVNERAWSRYASKICQPASWSSGVIHPTSRRPIEMADLI